MSMNEVDMRKRNIFNVAQLTQSEQKMRDMKKVLWLVAGVL